MLQLDLLVETGEPDPPVVFPPVVFPPLEFPPDEVVFPGNVSSPEPPPPQAAHAHAKSMADRV
ncbi:MAG: hypothetical protein HYS18_03425 [Burkholderiales bacterium]|nr:hypothetical protein [Burkholderiales bacterium]